jgi:hypothetical protein
LGKLGLEILNERIDAFHHRTVDRSQKSVVIHGKKLGAFVAHIMKSIHKELGVLKHNGLTIQAIL